MADWRVSGRGDSKGNLGGWGSSSAYGWMVLSRYSTVELGSVPKVSQDPHLGVGRVALLSGCSGDYFQAHAGCWQNSVSDCCRTEALLPY